MPSDKIRRSRIVRGSKRSRVPIKSALKKRKMEAEKESITTRQHPAARQIFARLESFLARYDATKRESTVCMPPAPMGEHQCVEWCGELVDTKGFRTDPARQEYSIEKSKNSADDPGRGQDQCAKKKRVLSCDFQHGIDSFHGIAQIV